MEKGGARERKQQIYGIGKVAHTAVCVLGPSTEKLAYGRNARLSCSFSLPPAGQTTQVALHADPAGMNLLQV